MNNKTGTGFELKGGFILLIFLIVLLVSGVKIFTLLSNPVALIIGILIFWALFK